VRQQHSAGRGESHPPCISFEQLKTELAFQRLDPLSERRLGEVEVLCGMTEVAEIGDLYESSELSEFHVSARLWGRCVRRLKL
jgi:hypothetical protein